jgi:hypothetical protein
MSNEKLESRRRFLGQVTLTVGGIAVSGFAQASLLEACLAPAVMASGYVDPCGDWQLDDIFAAYPPYAFATGAAVPHTRPAAMAHTGADWHWLA